MNFYIFKGNVLQAHSWLRSACSFSVEWIQHASRSSSSRLSHLLWTNVYRPPNWSVYCEVLIVYVSYVSPTFFAWICLDVYPFEGSFHLYISKSYVPNATASHMRGYTTNAHADSQPNLNILHKHVTSAIVIMTRLGHNNIIKILNS
jgi:hypothetical protein